MAADAKTAAPVEKPPRTLLVRAIKMGFYPDPGEIRQRVRNPGDVFMLRTEHHFAGPAAGPFQWMEWADEATKVVPATEPVAIMSVPNRMVQDPLRPGEPRQAAPLPAPAIKP